MATAELVCEGSFEIEFTAPPLTSDQSKALSPSNPKHTPAVKTQPPSEGTEHPPPPARDTGLQTNPDTTETQKDCSVLDENATPQVCQQVEIVTEEASKSEPVFPRIDAVWSISQEHSYEQKLPKGVKQKSFHTSQNEAETDVMHDASYGNGKHSMDTQHTPVLPHSQAKGTEVLKTCSVRMPQVLKVQGKSNKKYFIHDSPDLSIKPSKYPSLHGSKSQPVTKSFKTLKVLQLPSHSSTHSSWNSCLIDHNIKPLQIQHNLEHKNKALAVLKLETLSLKYRDDAEDFTHCTRDADAPCSPAALFSGRGHKGKFTMKDAATDNLDDSHTDEEVGTDAVYMDVDPDPSSNPDFMESVEQGEDMEEEDGGEEGLEHSSMHNLSMDHYLPDFTDLPPFPNIPMDQPEDQYTEPAQLTPSIQHNLFEYSWPQTYPVCNHQISSSSFPAQITALPNSASTSTVPNPGPLAVMQNTTSPSPLPVHNPNPVIPTPNSALLGQAIDSTAHAEPTTIPDRAGAVEDAGAVGTMFNVSNSADTTLLSRTRKLEAATTSGATTHLVTATDITTATGTFPATAGIKMEMQDSWSGSAETSQPPTIISTLPASGDSTLPPSSSSDSQAPIHTDGTISTALMTAFDLDSQPSSLMDHHHQVSGSGNNSSYPYPDQPYPEPPYPDPSYTDAAASQPPYCENGGLGIGCSSMFLSPPPSVEPAQVSQGSTPCPDNESGYLTMEEQELQSPAGLYWPHHHHHHHHLCPGSSAEDVDNGYGHANTAYPATVGSGFGEGGGYPYTHQDSHYQTLHQTASTTTTTSNGGSNNNNDIIYYPFNDLMQLNPSLLGSDSDMSIQYVHPSSYPQSYPPQTLSDPCSDPGQGYLDQAGTGRRRGRGGRPRGTRQCLSSQIQSDQISSSLQRQLQAQMGAPLKRQYRRRNPDGRRKTSIPKTPRCSVLDGGEKRGRHNEPLNQKAVDIMYDWYRQHEDNPYPSKEEKEVMAVEGGITTMQVKSWFANKRNRSNNTRPKVQKRAMEEKLMQIYNQLSKTEGASVEEGGNSFIIKELSQIIHNKLDPDSPTLLDSLP